MNSSRPARIPCIPETSTGGLRRSRARSADVTSTTTAPSLTMQQSKRRSGAITSREARWSSRVIGFCITAFGFRRACERKATATSPRASVVAP